LLKENGVPQMHKSTLTFARYRDVGNILQQEKDEFCVCQIQYVFVFCLFSTMIWKKLLIKKIESSIENNEKYEIYVVLIAFLR
jgi:hypothetical protein